MSNINKPIEIAVLYICTGEYSAFWELFYSSMKKNFLRKSNIQFFVFTDDKTLEYKDNSDVHVIEQKKYEWPYSTLLRFEMMSKIEKQIRTFDYCFFFNANMICLQEITEEEFLPMDNDLLVVEHPGHFTKQLSEWDWERNPLSTAYIQESREKVYVAGGLNGGKANAFMDMILELKNNIQVDLDNGIIAKFHDESHLNRYILDHPNYKLLSSAYLYPERRSLPVEQRIVLLEKHRYIDVDLIKKRNISEKEYIRAIKGESKWLQNYEVIKEMYYIEKFHMNIGMFFKKRNIKKIALYGYRNLGKIAIDCFNNLNDPKVEIKYIIDQKCAELKGYNFILPNQVLEIHDTDCIIVSAVHDYFNIWKKLSKQYENNIFSLSYVVHEVYLECIKNN